MEGLVVAGNDDILRFWFGFDLEGPIPPQQLGLWFAGGEQADQLIRERFGADVQRAAQGDFDTWGRSPAGRLALILLHDQFTRNIHRGSGRAYAQDTQARQLTLEGLEAGHDLLLSPVERAFFYLPLEHAEELELQERSVALFAALIEAAPAAQRQSFEGFYDYAVRHRDIIARFGRFPHRNLDLGRPSTLEEAAFLKEPGSSF